MKLILEQANNLKHEFLLKLTYGTGMRLEEVIELEWTDINTDRRMILIRDAKNNNDRYVPLPQKVLALIPAFREKYKPIKYVIEPENKPGKQLADRTAQEVFAYCLKKSGIDKPATFHTLRHCFVVKNWNHLDICLARILSGKPGKGCKMGVIKGGQDSKAHGNGLKNFRRRR
jgi:integrase/recombinase XerD